MPVAYTNSRPNIAADNPRLTAGGSLPRADSEDISEADYVRWVKQTATALASELSFTIETRLLLALLAAGVDGDGRHRLARRSAVSDTTTAAALPRLVKKGLMRYTPSVNGGGNWGAYYLTAEGYDEAVDLIDRLSEALSSGLKRPPALIEQER